MFHHITKFWEQNIAYITVNVAMSGNEKCKKYSERL